jgi:hypothetical protein
MGVVKGCPGTVHIQGGFSREDCPRYPNANNSIPKIVFRTATIVPLSLHKKNTESIISDLCRRIEKDTP